MRDVQGVIARLRSRRTAWVWLSALGFACGVAVVVVACTVHDRCIGSDPGCVFHSYTLLHTAGPGVLVFVGAPVLISLLVGGLLAVKVLRRSARAGEVAWFLAVLSCLIGIVGLPVEGFLMLLDGALILAAVAAAPLPPDPNDRLARAERQTAAATRASS